MELKMLPDEEIFEKNRPRKIESREYRTFRKAPISTLTHDPSPM
jgi:hypothetical protein